MRLKKNAPQQTKLTADVPLRSAFLTDILDPAKILSLVSQKESSDIITTTDSVKRSREKYARWHKRFCTHPEKVFELPTLKRILSQVDIKLKYWEGERQYIQYYAASKVFPIASIIDSENWTDLLTMLLQKSKKVTTSCFISAGFLTARFCQQK